MIIFWGHIEVIFGKVFFNKLQDIIVQNPTHILEDFLLKHIQTWFLANAYPILVSFLPAGNTYIQIIYSCILLVFAVLLLMFLDRQFNTGLEKQM